MKRKITLIGLLLSSREAVVTEVDVEVAETLPWVDAVWAEIDRYGDDYQFICAVDGSLEVQGTWENMPEDPPGWRPATGPYRPWTVIGFDFVMGGMEVVHEVDEVDWPSAGHQAMAAGGTQYQLVSVITGAVVSQRFIYAWSWLVGPGGENDSN